jgi:membrane-associated phospholipid phosphatase
MMMVRLGGALVAFAALVFALPTAHGWDERFTIWLQRAAPSPDGPASTLVRLGDAEVLIPVVALVGGLVLIRNRRSGVVTLWLAARLVIASLVVVALQHLIVHPGPPESLHRPADIPGLDVITMSHILPLGRTVLTMVPATPYSFPSGHAIRFTLLAGAVFRTVPWAAGMLVVGMMAALVYHGDHWLSDVLGGLCLGWALSEMEALITIIRIF